MPISKFKLFLFSSNPDSLLPFYTDVLGIQVKAETKKGTDYGYALEVSPGYEIWLARHSKVEGKNKDPFRQMINLYTDNVREMYEKIKQVEGVEIIQEPVAMDKFVPGETRLVCTFLDPEGNCLQFMEPK